MDNLNSICKFLYLYLQESIVQYGWVGIVFVFVFGTAYFNTDGWVAGTNNRKTLSPIGDCGTTIPDRSVPELRDVLGILRLILRSQLYFTSPYITVSVVLYFAFRTVSVPLACTLLERFLLHTGGWPPITHKAIILPTTLQCI